MIFQNVKLHPSQIAEARLTDFAEYVGAPQSKSMDERHGCVTYMMSAKYLVQGLNFQCAADPARDAREASGSRPRA